MLDLIINAIEAMRARSDGSRELRITTDENESGGVVVAVQDSGLGVNPADLERIFDAFYSTKPNGLGIGLSVCRAIIEADGGKLGERWEAPGDYLPVHVTGGRSLCEPAINVRFAVRRPRASSDEILMA